MTRVDDIYNDLELLIYEHKTYRRIMDENIRLTNAIEDIKAEINEEKECAYADFERYKVEYLGIDPEYVEDELPNDDFRYGMERCLEIIDKHIAERRMNYASND